MQQKDAISSITEKAEELSRIQRLKLETIENNYITAKEELVEENQSLAKLIENEYELIEEYSVFKNVGRVMSILSDITSLYMGEEYFWAVNDDVPVLIPKNLDNSEQIINFYDEYNPGDDSLKFYKYDGDVEGELFQYTLFESENLENYDFLKRFIDYVISYKFETRRHNLSIDILRMLEKEFIIENIDEIRKINDEKNNINSENSIICEKILKRFISFEKNE